MIKKYKKHIKSLELYVSQWDHKILMKYKDLESFYLTWCNDYLTISRMAEEYGMSDRDTKKAIRIGRAVFNNQDLEEA